MANGVRYVVSSSFQSSKVPTSTAIHYRFIGILEYTHTEPTYTADSRKGVAVKYMTQSA